MSIEKTDPKSLATRDTDSDVSDPSARKTYIVRPGQHVTHGDEEATRKHFSTMPPGTPFTGWPAAPLEKYGEGDELELTEDEAAKIAHAVCTPEEWEKESSPEALVKKGYTRDEAESMVASRESARETRAKDRKKSLGSKLPSAWGANPVDPKDAGKEVNPVVMGAKFPPKEPRDQAQIDRDNAAARETEAATGGKPKASKTDDHK
jgi:hypothetical protein